jgi:hypothetical protein
VFCQIEWLRDCFPPDIRRALKELPKSLDETYERILLGIGNAKREYAHHLLQCLAVSIRPLRVEELAEVLAVRLDDEEDAEYDSDWRPEDARQAVLSACSSLITIANADGSPVVQFSHFSVKEFLMSSRLANFGEHLSLYHVIPSSAHAFLSRSCLSVLLSLGDSVDKSAVEQHPFAIYAARYWVDHAKVEGVSLGICDLMMGRLFDPGRPYFATWVWIYDIDRPWKHQEKRSAIISIIYRKLSRLSNYRGLFSPHDKLSIIQTIFRQLGNKLSVYYHQIIGILSPNFHEASQKLSQNYFGIM